MQTILRRLFAAAVWLGLLCSVFASPPVLRRLPDPIVGDAEDNVGTDNNFFVFTNAFEFDKYVQDADTTVSALMWSFDEHSGPLPPDLQWYRINGMDPVHVGDAAMGEDDVTTHPDHLRPDLAGKDLRSVSPYLTFRDIVFSPGTGVPPPPFGEPTEPAKSDHAAGKKIRLYVSDGSSTASTEIRICTIDNGNDAFREQPSPVVISQDDNFTTDVTNPTPGGFTGWTLLDPLNQTNRVGDYDATNTALRVTIATGNTARINGWQTGNSEWVPYSAVGTGRIAWSRFFVFRTGQTDMGDLNQIPNMRFRVSQRFAVSSILEVFNHAPNQRLDVQRLAWELRPSSTPTNPSVYAVDLDPIDVPQMSVMGQPPYPEGFSRAFEAYSLEPQEYGSVELTECVAGHYSKTLLNSDSAVTERFYRTSPSDAGDLRVFDPSSEGAFRRLWVMLGPGGYLGSEILPLPGTGVPTYTESSAGITLDSTAVATDRFALIARDFAVNLGQNSDRMRVSEYMQYLYRFHVTSTTNSNTNPMLRLRAYTVKFQWAQKLEIGGALAAGHVNNLIAAQALPGIGCQNPDRDGTETGGYYNLIMRSPIDPYIQSSQPYLRAQPGPQDPLPVSGTSKRDIKFGIDLIDTISGSSQYYMENGNFRLDKVDIYETYGVPTL
jgi:hypothetical protein